MFVARRLSGDCVIGLPRSAYAGGDVVYLELDEQVTLLRGVLRCGTHGFLHLKLYWICTADLRLERFSEISAEIGD
jgi:hypothetical protein